MQRKANGCFCPTTSSSPSPLASVSAQIQGSAPYLCHWGNKPIIDLARRARAVIARPPQPPPQAEGAALKALKCQVPCKNKHCLLESEEGPVFNSSLMALTWESYTGC